MAVKINNTENIRKSKRWNERDDAALCSVLRKKIKDVSVGMRECSSPYERSHLKEQLKHYKEMLHKVESGSYNGDIIFSEMRAAAELEASQRANVARLSSNDGAKQYLNSYMDMDFDYESALRKKRYYGFSLPLIMLLLCVVIIGVFIMGAFITPAIRKGVSDAELGISIDAMFTYRLSSDFDITLPNSGEWPTGTYDTDDSGAVYPAPEQGVKYADALGNIPEKVNLYKDLHMVSIDITAFDIIKAWFRTPMLKKVRLDFLEDNKLFQGDSYYYLCLMAGQKADSYKIAKDADGNFDISAIIRHLGVYGGIINLILAFLCALIGFILNFIRMFGYTARRAHVPAILGFIFSILAFIAPALATIDGTAILPAITNYFMSLTDSVGFYASTDTIVGVGILYFVPIGLNLILMILPKLFRNRFKKIPRSIPKGNRNRPALGFDPYVVNENDLNNII